MSELSILGLSSNEEKLYRELLVLKKSTALNLAKNTGVPQNRVYDYLDNLIKKGFVRIFPGKTKQYLPAPPDELETIVEEKKKELEKTHNIVKELTKIYKTTKQQPIEFIVGKRNFWKFLDSIPQTKKYGYSIKYNLDTNPVSVRKYKASMLKGIEHKTLARIDKETYSNYKKWEVIDPGTIKPINNEGVIMDLRDDETVLFTILGIDGSLLIRDEAFAKMMKELFLARYNQK